MNVLFFPKWDQANPYLRLLRESLENREVKIFLSDYNDGILSIIPALNAQKINIDIIHLHWISPLAMKICWPRSNFIFYIKCLIICSEIFYCRLRGVRFIWTIHNRVSHESKHEKREIFLRKLIIRLSGKVILHSEPAKELIEENYKIKFYDKFSIIPHGNYDGCYPPPSDTKDVLRERFGYNNSQKIILYFGKLKPYKGVEKIICATNRLQHRRDLRFVIAGEVEDPTYKKKLLGSSESGNVVFDLRFLDDQSLVDYIEAADIILLPFADGLTSGSVILSMTLGKCLILSSGSKVFGCVDEGGAFYFDDQDNLLALLENVNDQAIRNAGIINATKSKELNWSRISKLTKCVYEL